jgi:hypothetical protein
MNPLNYSRSLLWTVAGLALPGALLADTIIMKDGKKYENAKVLEETVMTVRFDYIVVGKIHDERVEQKANVAQIIKQRPEEMEWKDLKSKLTLPMPDMTTADRYESTIQDSLRPFVTKFPGTPEAKEVEALIKELQAEKEKVTSGSVKIDGQWISAELAKRDARNIDAFKNWAEVRDLLAGNKVVEGLNKWLTFRKGADNYVDTVHYVKAVPEVLKVLNSYEAQLRQMIADQPILQRRRDDNLKSLVEPDLGRVKRAIEQEAAAYKQAMLEAKQMHREWGPTNKYDLKGLQDALKSVLEEKAELATLDLKKLQEQAETIQAVRHYIADRNAEGATTALAKIEKTELRELSTHVSLLKTELNKLKADISKNKNKERITGKVNVPDFSSTGTSRIDAAMSKAESGETAASAALDKAGQETLKKEGTGSKPKAAVATAADEKEAARGKTVQRPRSRTISEPVEEEGDLFTTILIYGGLPLLAVLGFLMWQQKKKQNS